MDYGFQKNTTLLKVTGVEALLGGYDFILIVEDGTAHFRAPCMRPTGSPIPSVGDFLLMKTINRNDGWISVERWVNQHSDGCKYILCGLTKIQQ
jgi:hypothetical protein